MLNRRSLLVAAGALVANALLAGCQRNPNASLRVRLLQNSIPVQLLQAFQQQLSSVDFLTSEQLADLFKLLQDWKNPVAEQPRSLPLPIGDSATIPIADLITLGDYWLTAAIQQGLIQPLPLDQVAGWQQLPAAWQRLVRRDRQGQLSETGNFWAAPYRWGSLVIAYNIKHFKQLGWTPTDWQDLWRPELQGHLSLLDSARSVIGLTLKKIGQSINAGDLAALPNLAEELKALHQQVKFYSSDAYLQPLLLGDSWAAVGWSTEVLPVMKRDPRIAAVVPASGSILTADLWVRPAGIKGSTTTAAQTGIAATPEASLPATVKQWLEFCWQPPTATQLSALSSAASPVLVTLDRSQLPTAVQQNSLLLPAAEVIERSEFLLPIANSDQYRQLWEMTRRMG